MRNIFRVLFVSVIFHEPKAISMISYYLSWINFREDLFSRVSIFARINFREWHFQIFRVD